MECLVSIKAQLTIVEIRNKEYTFKRNQILQHVKLLIEKFELTKHIYYLTVSLIDKILSKEVSLPNEVVTIGCLLLASKSTLT
jgi:hypothetical protein